MGAVARFPTRFRQITGPEKGHGSQSAFFEYVDGAKGLISGKRDPVVRPDWLLWQGRSTFAVTFGCFSERVDDKERGGAWNHSTDHRASVWAFMGWMGDGVSRANEA